MNEHAQAIRTNKTQFQPEFLETLADQAYDLVVSWMKENQVPEPIIRLLEGADTLRLCAQKLAQEGELKGSIDGEDLLETLPEVTRLIWMAGGEFSDGATQTVHEGSIEWGNPALRVVANSLAQASL